MRGGANLRGFLRLLVAAAIALGGVVSAQASVFVLMSDAELAAASHAAWLATVRSIESAMMADGRIYTYVTLAADDKLAGSEAELDRNNPNGNAALCINCGQCVAKCPQEINIPVELEKAHAILGKRRRISDHYS